MGRSDDECGGTCESSDDRMRDEAHHEAEPEDAHRELYEPDHECKEDGESDEVFAFWSRKRCERGEDEEAHDGDRSGRELGRAAEESGDASADEAGIETVDWRQSGEHGVGHGLWYEDDGYCEAGREVGAEFFPVIGPDPPEERECLCDHMFFL